MSSIQELQSCIKSLHNALEDGSGLECLEWTDTIFELFADLPIKDYADNLTRAHYIDKELTEPKAEIIVEFEHQQTIIGPKKAREEMNKSSKELFIMHQQQFRMLYHCFKNALFVHLQLLRAAQDISQHENIEESLTEIQRVLPYEHYTNIHKLISEYQKYHEHSLLVNIRKSLQALLA